MVFHDVTHSISVSGKVLEKADMDFFHSSNANYSCHVFKPCSKSKEYRVHSMKEDNLDIYSLPPTRFEQADSLCPTISSLPFKTHFFSISSHFIIFSSPYFFHPTFLIPFKKSVQRSFPTSSLTCFYFPALSLYP